MTQSNRREFLKVSAAGLASAAAMDRPPSLCSG